jgi:hypothetical protein
LLAKRFHDRVKIRLGTLGAIRSEMSTVYKAAVRGDLTWQDASKAVYILGAIAALDQGVGMDARLAEIEAKLAAVRPNGSTDGAPHARRFHPHGR